MRSSKSSGLSTRRIEGGQGGTREERGRGAGWHSPFSELDLAEPPALLLALIMHFEDGRDGSRAPSEGFSPCRALLPRSAGGAVAVSSGCVGEGGVRACPPPSTVFLAFRVTLQSHSAESVCCSLSSAPQRVPSWGPSVSPEFSLPKRPVLDGLWLILLLFHMLARNSRMRISFGVSCELLCVLSPMVPAGGWKAECPHVGHRN